MRGMHDISRATSFSPRPLTWCSLREKVCGAALPFAASRAPALAPAPAPPGANGANRVAGADAGAGAAGGAGARGDNGGEDHSGHPVVYGRQTPRSAAAITAYKAGGAPVHHVEVCPPSS